MSALFWHTCGAGKRDLVLLHGWGLNAEVWRCIVPLLSAQFRLHLVDLPGYGRSGGDTPYSLAEMTQRVLAQAPARALWLGWSLGGLVATQAALHHPQRVSGLITVASSPCFTAQTAWPGIRDDVLHHFQSQLRDDFQRTVERFLALQTLGTDSARQDARALKSVVLAQPMPSAAVLNGGCPCCAKPICARSWRRWRRCGCASMVRWTVWFRAEWRRWWMRSARAAAR